MPTQRPDQAPENILAGLLVVVPAVLISAIVLLAGARHLPREMALMLAKLKAAPHDGPPGIEPDDGTHRPPGRAESARRHSRTDDQDSRP